jgi:DnaJ-class molecular chaperone
MNNDNGFLAAQRAYERHSSPDDDESELCEECEGEGTLHVPDGHGQLEVLECPVCKGHGNMDAVKAESEVERQIEAQDRRAEEHDEDRDQRGIVL